MPQKAQHSPQEVLAPQQRVCLPEGNELTVEAQNGCTRLVIRCPAHVADVIVMAVPVVVATMSLSELVTWVRKGGRMYQRLSGLLLDE